VAASLVILAFALAIVANCPGNALSAHMAAHVATMGVAAPLAAYGLGANAHGSRSPPGGAWLWTATAVQMALLWTAHAPQVIDATAADPHRGPILHLLLAGTALVFWRAIFARNTESPVQPIAALLVTAKLACLLGVLLVFAPRPLYGELASFCGGGQWTDLEDQRRAGLLMLFACPATYMTAALVISSRWLTRLARGA
jgi:putative membrane protein